MKHTFGNWAFIILGIFTLITIISAEGGIMPKLAGFGGGIIFMFMLMVILKIIEFP